MKEQIGETAGILWYTLGEQGRLPITNLTKYVRGGTKEVAHIALGWLARENKIKFESKGEAVLVSLTDEETEVFKRCRPEKSASKSVCRS